MTASSHAPDPTTPARRWRRKPKLLPYVADSILLEEAGMPTLVRSSMVAAIAIVLLFIG